MYVHVYIYIYIERERETHIVILDVRVLLEAPVEANDLHDINLYISTNNCLQYLIKHRYTVF